MRIGKSLIAAVALLLCSSLAYADLTVTTKAAQVVVTVTPSIVTQIETVDGDKIGDVIPSVGKPTIQPAAPAVIVQLKSDRDLSKSLVKIKCATADITMVEIGVYVVSKVGTHVLDVNVISSLSYDGWDDEQLTITVGKAEPPPPPPPPPTDLDAITKVSRDTAPADPETAKLIGDFIKQAATNIDVLCEAGNCPSFDVARASYQQAIGNALGSRPRGSQTDWTPWRKGLEAVLRTAGLETVEQLKAAMLAITKGI